LLIYAKLPVGMANADARIGGRRSKCDESRLKAVFGTK
jgi:hypothetical protein